MGLTDRDRERFNDIAAELDEDRRTWRRERWRTTVRMVWLALLVLFTVWTILSYPSLMVLILSVMVYITAVTDLARTFERQNEARQRWDGGKDT